MPITEQDIKLLQSARMTDTPDGGGRMTGNVVQSGVDNNIFDDVSNLDRVYGNVSLRKVFPAVLTNDTDKYLGSRVIIDEPPEDANIDGTLFAASSLFDTRESAKQRVEAYLTLGAAVSARLFGPHIAGMMAITTYQQEASETPNVGAVFVLHQETGSAVTEQYVRVATASSVVQTFSDSDGDFKRRIVTLGLTDALRYDFSGFEMQRSDVAIDWSTKCRIYSTVVANAAQYFGIRPLETAASIGDFSIKADAAFGQLLPNAQIETPITDARANPPFSTLVPSVGTPLTLTVLPPDTTHSLYIGTAVTPGSIMLTQGSVTATDAGGKLMLGSAEIGAVDYANGVIVASTNDFTNALPATIAYQVAAVVAGTPQSIGVMVRIENRSMTASLTLGSTPVAASLRVSYMAEGKWYTLSEDGTGVLRGVATGQGAGTLNYSTRSVTTSFGALPDVGSAVIYTWVSSATVQSAETLNLRNSGKLFFPIATGKALTPSSFSVTWHNSGTKTATDNGVGVITGDASGIVDYQTGAIYLSPNELPAKNTVFTIASTARNIATTDVAVTGGGTPSVSFTIPGGSVAPGTVTFAAKVTAKFDYAPLGDKLESYIGVTFTDNGVGGISATFFDVAGTKYTHSVGTINYTSGLVLVTLPETLFIGKMFNSSFRYGDGQGNVYATQETKAVVGSFGSSVIQIETTTSGGAPTTAIVGVSRGSGLADSAPSSAILENLYAAADYVPGGSALGALSFKLGPTGGESVRHVSTPAGAVIANPSNSAGQGATVGSVSGSLGLVTIGTWSVGWSPDLIDVRGQFLAPSSGSDARYDGSRVLFRLPSAPVRPASLQLSGVMSDGTAFTVTASSNGHISGTRVKGLVDYQVGVVELQFCNPATTSLGTVDISSWGLAGVSAVNIDTVRQETLVYNAVAYTYLPLDADILGLDPVRLPSDGRVPIFKAGRVVVVHNTQKLAPQTVANSQTVDCGRTLLSRIRVLGNDGLEIASGFTKNLDAGTITFTNVAGYSQPVTVEHRIEDEALCADAQINGHLRLTRPLTHAYPADTSYVSSAYVVGTLQAAAQDSFAQETWTNVWSDERIGAPILAQYNDTVNPLAVTNAGAITERWLIQFTSNTTFDLIGEEVGQIITGNTSTTLAPVNPATGVPYFTLQPAGWGSGWAAGNCLRFNTRGANFPLWIARTVRQSPSAPPGTDQMTISVRGDIDQ